MITGGKIAEYGADLGRQRLQTVATCTQDLKHIGVLLMRHDARAGGERIGQGDEAEVLTCIMHHVGGEPGNGGCALRDGYGCEFLCASARHLSKGARHMNSVEVQCTCRELSVKGQSCSIPCCTAERICIGSINGHVQHTHVFDECFCITSEPESEARWHGDLVVSVAGKKNVLMLFGKIKQEGRSVTRGTA